MDALDSRSLRYTDCFVQQFPAADKISYWITSPVGRFMPADEERAFTIHVSAKGANTKKGKADGQQHTVTVRYKDGTFLADPPELEIAAGDFVLWNTPDPAAPGFVVMGEGEQTKFDSAALSAGSVYTHAFGLPGEYSWMDANCTSIQGKIRVSMPEMNMQDPKGYQRKLLKTLEQPVMIVVKDEHTDTVDAQAIVGQTVVWAVERSSGTAVVDTRLVADRMSNTSGLG